MAIQDAKLLFSEDVAPGAVGAHDSTNIVDLGIGTDAFGSAQNSDPGAGGDLFLNIVITAAIAATGGASTVAFKLQHCATEGGSYEDTSIDLDAIAKATLVAGYVVISQSLPKGLMRFLKLVVTVATNDVTSGTYSAWIGDVPFSTK
jgi:hypothetical protein